MDSRRYVIVGGSAAGLSAAQTIRRYDPEGAILILSEEDAAPYYRPMIPFLISRKKNKEDIFLQGRGPYQAEGVKVLLQTRAKGVDTRAGCVLTEKGETMAYDRLLIATGSKPYIPPDIEGLEHDGVYLVRTLAHAVAAEKRATGAKQAIMVGGGLLNMKTAFALLERGLLVTMVVTSPEVLSRLMEPDDALLIRQALDRAGLKIITGCTVKQITADGEGVNGVVLEDGRELACDMVCIGKGVQPNTAWIDDQDIIINDGVVVDTATCTSVPSVYAAGDVAVTHDPITGEPIVTGLWTNAVEMGRCAGANMAGHPVAYGGTFGILNATQVARMPFVSMGIVHTNGTEYETCVRATDASYRKLVFSADGERLVGALFIGDIEKAGLYRLLIRERMPIAGIKQQVIEHQLHYGHLLLPVSTKTKR